MIYLIMGSLLACGDKEEDTSVVSEPAQEEETSEEVQDTAREEEEEAEDTASEEAEDTPAE
jgi:hypothetical protein